MRKLTLAGLVAAAVLTIPSRSQAQVSVGLRAGYAVPSGDALEVPELGRSFEEKDLFKAELPLQADLYLQLTGHLSVGVYYSYAFASKGTLLKDFCDGIPGASCKKLYGMRFGVQGEYDLLPHERLDPWVAVGTGMEIAHFRVDGFVIPTPLGPVGGDLDGTLRGWEWLNAQAGADWRVSPAFSMGPYVQYAMGRYTVEKIELGGESVASGGIKNSKTHEWFTVGLRARFGP